MVHLPAAAARTAARTGAVAVRARARRGWARAARGRARAAAGGPGSRATSSRPGTPTGTSSPRPGCPPAGMTALVLNCHLKGDVGLLVTRQALFIQISPFYIPRSDRQRGKAKIER